jgi:hypothetical protein
MLIAISYDSNFALMHSHLGTAFSFEFGLKRSGTYSISV